MCRSNLEDHSQPSDPETIHRMTNYISLFQQLTAALYIRMMLYNYIFYFNKVTFYLHLFYDCNFSTLLFNYF